MKEKPDNFCTGDGEVCCWVEQASSVMLQAVTKSGDPVELTKKEAVALANALLNAAKRID